MCLFCAILDSFLSTTLSHSHHSHNLISTSTSALLLASRRAGAPSLGRKRYVTGGSGEAKRDYPVSGETRVPLLPSLRPSSAASRPSPPSLPLPHTSPSPSRPVPFFSCLICCLFAVPRCPCSIFLIIPFLLRNVSLSLFEVFFSPFPFLSFCLLLIHPFVVAMITITFAHNRERKSIRRGVPQECSRHQLLCRWMALRNSMCLICFMRTILLWEGLAKHHHVLKIEKLQNREVLAFLVQLNAEEWISVSFGVPGYSLVQTKVTSFLRNVISPFFMMSIIFCWYGNFPTSISTYAE